MASIDQRAAKAYFLLGWGAILVSVVFFGWSDTWSMLSVPSMYPEFADMRTVQGALSSQHQNLNPQLINPGDPWNRPMNYPSVWISIAKVFGLNDSLNFLVFVSIMVGIFLACCYTLLATYPSFTLLLMCFSGCTLLAVERGNNDVLIFSILYVTAISGVRTNAIAIFFATSLKIFPLLTVPAFCRSLKHGFIIVIAVIAALAFIWPELSNIKSETPSSASFSYGSASLTAAFRMLGFHVPGIIISTCLLGASLTLLCLQGVRTATSATGASSGEQQMFLIGALVYCGTFVLSSNWDYRIIFLMFCVPYINKMSLRGLSIAISIFLVVAANQAPLYLLLGLAGAGLNLIAKVGLMVLLSCMAGQMLLDQARRASATTQNLAN